MSAEFLPGSMPEAFRHEALLCEGVDDFVERTAAFVRDGVDAGETVLVVVTPQKLGPLREAVGPDGGVLFADMTEVGRNPARIIPLWHDFLDAHQHDAGGVRGVGEPIFSGRTDDELAECIRHELLLNAAFDGSPGWSLLCPYDVLALDPRVVAEAHRTHPFVCHDGESHPSEHYHDDPATVFAGDLPAPAAPVEELAFDAGGLDAVRRFVLAQASRLGLGEARTGDLVLAVHELATNSVRHGGGAGWVRIWGGEASVACEVHDCGRIDHPLVGRVRPSIATEDGRGMWLVNHLCDLVQVRSAPGATVVRVHMRHDG